MNNFPAMTEEQRQELIDFMQGSRTYRYEEWSRLSKLRDQITLAALTADTSKLAELAAKVRKVREDVADFDGDRRGMWEYQEEQEQLLLEEAVKYTAPSAPVLCSPAYHDEAKRLAELHGMSFVVFRHGEAPTVADPTRVIIGFTDKGLGHDTAPAQYESLSRRDRNNG